MARLPFLKLFTRVDATTRDALLAGALCVWGLVDLWAVGGAMTRIHGAKGPASAFILAVSVPLAWRRRRPFPVQCAVMAAIAIDSIAVGKAPQGMLVLFPILIAMYSVGAHSPLRIAIAGFAVGFAGTLVEALLDPEVASVGDLVVVESFFFVFLGGGLWAVGRYVRGRRRDVALVEGRVEVAEREHEARTNAAVAAERDRIARELHDVIAHSVSLMGVQAGAADRVLEHDPQRAREALRSIQVTARESVGELRRLLGILRADGSDAALAPQPGLNAVGALVEDARRAGLDVELVTHNGDGGHVPPGVSLSAYRVVQEALTNARKHAPGASARIEVRQGPDHLELVVENGAARASAGPAAPGTGNGLVGMRERVALYGGSLTAQPRPDGGFRVRARLPLETAQ